jgi:hypothetical protein
MADVVPGVSVCPTLIKLDDTHKGNTSLDDWLDVMKIVRPTSTVAANARPFACRNVQRACPAFWRLDLEPIFTGVTPPAISFRAGEELTIGEIRSVARLRDTLDGTLAKFALDENRV